MSKYIPADKLIAEIKVIQQSLESRDVRFNQVKKIRTECMIEFCKSILEVIASLQQEQPEVELEKEIEEEWEMLEKDYAPSALDKSYIIVSGLVGEKQFFLIARHFYELGLNARKEE